MKKKYETCLDLGPRQLWKLRQEITVNSIYKDDYENSFNLPPEDVGAFFDGWLDWCEEIMREEFGDKENYNFWWEFKKYDNYHYLNEYRSCFN